MKVQDIISKVNGTLIYSPQESDIESGLQYGATSDLMSDVLTLTEDNVILVTGLATVQTIRTAAMADISYILFVRNKQISPRMIELAEEDGITLLSTKHSSFSASILLGELGLKGIY